MAEHSFFQNYREAIREELRALLPPTHPIYDLLRYHIGWYDEQGRPGLAEGKMVRGILCLAAAGAVGMNYQRTAPAAAAIELVHNFSLIHDDIEDISELRRSRPTVWKIWGQPLAINAGDALLILAHMAVLKLEGRGIGPEKVFQCLGIVDKACLELCLGQHEDLSFQERLDIGLDDYIKMIYRKTAALFEASSVLGANLGTEDTRLVQGLGAFGRALGLAFQIQDDAIGIWGQAQVTGKPEDSDIYEKKKTLPVVYALAEAVGEERRELEHLYRQERLGAGDVDRLRDILSRLGAQTYTRGMAEKYFHQAHTELEALSLPDKTRGELEAISRYLLMRET